MAWRRECDHNDAECPHVQVKADIWLTKRQHRTLVVMVRGQRNKEAAYELGVSEQTVKNHLFAVYQVLGVNSLTGAYYALGWLKPPAD